VVNVAPRVDAGADQTANEGAVVSLAPATFNDPGTLDTHTATIDWGDGTTVTVGVVSESPFGPPGSTGGANGTVSGSHVYADNGTYTVTLTVTDDDGGAGQDTLTVSVANVNPTAVEAGSNRTVNVGEAVIFAGSFTDPGADTHAIAWNFGDGATAAGSLTPTHTFTAPGTFTVRLTVTDDDGGSGSDTLTVTVQAPAKACDIDRDGDVDRNDINIILAARNTRAAVGDPRDADRDRWITVNDARYCTLRCTRNLCATQ